MKGISAVIAVILILMITVALTAMAYVWFTGIFGQLTTGAGTVIGGATAAMGTQFALESAVGTTVSPYTVTVSIRNTGTETIDLTKVAAYVNEVKATTSGTTGTLAAGGVTTFDITGLTTSACNKVVKVTVAPATGGGVVPSQSISVTC